MYTSILIQIFYSTKHLEYIWMKLAEVCDLHEGYMLCSPNTPFMHKCNSGYVNTLSLATVIAWYTCMHAFAQFIGYCIILMQLGGC